VEGSGRLDEGFGNMREKKILVQIGAAVEGEGEKILV
jgi:hypothetical protein